MCIYQTVTVFRNQNQQVTNPLIPSLRAGTSRQSLWSLGSQQSGLTPKDASEFVMQRIKACWPAQNLSLRPTNFLRRTADQNLPELITRRNGFTNTYRISGIRVEKGESTAHFKIRWDSVFVVLLLTRGLFNWGGSTILVAIFQLLRDNRSFLIKKGSLIQGWH